MYMYMYHTNKDISLVDRKTIKNANIHVYMHACTCTYMYISDYHRRKIEGTAIMPMIRIYTCTCMY